MKARSFDIGDSIFVCSNNGEWVSPKEINNCKATVYGILETANFRIYKCRTDRKKECINFTEEDVDFRVFTEKKDALKALKTAQKIQRIEKAYSHGNLSELYC